ncbi:uvrD/REP helicase [Acinetobacter sp. CAG:196]|nr:uvrD/REP helicase [Acinetobacter sp. CAG:196]DAB15900.1 MAG TPA: ATP-dependent helicase [Candidatus Gastranaerophilales bacterium HUM_18]
MLLNFIKVDFRTKVLVEKYTELISAGVKPSEILVLVQNSTLKKQFVDKILENIKIDAIEKLNVHSFFSIVYNTLIENWCFIENAIPSDKHFILPNLVGLEVSQFLLKDILKHVEVKGYNSKKSLLHQIFRRYSLIVQNHLSNEQIQERSKILKESFAEDAELIIKKLLSSTLKSRSLDYLRQTLIFNHVYKHTDYFKNIKYLLVDDADEMTPVCFDFISYLKPQLKDWIICFDSLGSSRCGYLSADTSIECKLIHLFNEDVQTDKNIFSQGEIIFSNILENKHERLENFTLTSLSKRAEILDFTIGKIQNLFKKNIPASDITIITPLQDDMLRFTLEENLKHSCNLMFLSGSEKLIDNPLVKASLGILKLMLGIEISEMDLRVILSDYLGIPLKYCCPIFEGYKKTGGFPHISLEFYNEKYQKFIEVFEEVKEKNTKLSTKVFDLFYKLVDFADETKINKFNFFIKQLRDFESVLGAKTVIERADEIITQIENSIIAENPSTTLEIGENDLVIATPQKIIDNKISSKYQFWLDVSHSDWVKTDTGPLYNAWVFQADWTKDEYTVEDDIFLAKQKTARILRKLLLLAQEHVWACSSLFDPSGVENLGGIEDYLAGEANEDDNNAKPVFKITPRDDQKPVLDYKKGSMAISAVPGAGKTTILLALIIKLIERGVIPTNIFVLTYMDSAARNFRERIKNMCPNTTLLPNISTIHGLALKIIKENSNFERLNLSADFDICDDTQRMRIIKGITGKFTKTEADEFDRAISVLKLQEGDISKPSSDKKIEKFKTFFKEYQAQLREANLIDYDDILIMSVKLLENNPDILEYYQNICEYIIEDEAQDSSGVQQRLIGLLSGKHKNLIRCGDINQAITTTFSNADVEGFRRFIAEADTTVEMNHSQRCTQDVMTLANNLVNFGNEILPKAFFTSYMQGVTGKNPVSENAIFSRVFENAFAERNFVLKEIKNILTRNKNATIGILLRNNYQVASWAGFINDAGLKSITRSESLGQKGVFNTIFSILKFIQNPFDNEVLVSTYETLADLGFYKQRLQLEIRASEKPFIEKDGDDIESAALAQFLWDMQYWLNSSTLPLEELVIRIGLFYYTSDIEKSNVYLIAILVKRLNASGKFDLTLQRLEELAKKPTLSGFKFFSEEEDKDAMRGKVQIMTLHKSKGDEFEYVFLPEMAEKNLSIDVSKAKTKASTIFMEEVRAFNPSYKSKSELELREFNSEESLRLLYVAITRAQLKLYITTSAKAKGWGNKETEQEPSVIFGNILL